MQSRCPTLTREPRGLGKLVLLRSRGWPIGLSFFLLPTPLIVVVAPNTCLVGCHGIHFRVQYVQFLCYLITTRGPCPELDTTNLLRDRWSHFLKGGNSIPPCPPFSRGGNHSRVVVRVRKSISPPNRGAEHGLLIDTTTTGWRVRDKRNRERAVTCRRTQETWLIALG